MNTETSNEAAIAEFTRVLDAAKVLCDKVGEVVSEDRLGIGPDEVTWASVGDAHRIKATLAELAKTLGIP